MPRPKIRMQHVMDAIEDLARLVHRDPAGAKDQHEEIKSLVLRGIRSGDLQGLDAKLAARYALEAMNLAAMKTPVT